MVIYGTSNGAAAGAYVAAEEPDLVCGLVLAGPFVRDGKVSSDQRRLMSIMKMRFVTSRRLRPSTHQRLVRLKEKYDPDNSWRLNQNIAPRAIAAAGA